MKRDMDLARAILLAVEAHPESAPHWDKLELEFERQVKRDEFWGHVRLLSDAGYLMPLKEWQAGGLKLRGGLELSSAGHDFLDSTRDPEIWGKAKAGASSVGSWTFKMLGELAVGYARAKAAQIGLPLG